MIHSDVGLVFSFYIGGRRNAVQNFISNEWFGRRQRKTLRVGIPLVFVKFFSLFLTLFHPHLLRFYILPVPLTLAIWFALINRGEYCWHRVFPASKFLCLLTLRLNRIAAISWTSAKQRSRFTEMF